MRITNSHSLPRSRTSAPTLRMVHRSRTKSAYERMMDFLVSLDPVESYGDTEISYACRFKQLDIDMYNRVVSWITQESTTQQAQECADAIARAMVTAKYRTWKIQVVVRDNWNGSSTKWEGTASV